MGACRLVSCAPFCCSQMKYSLHFREKLTTTSPSFCKNHTFKYANETLILCVGLRFFCALVIFEQATFQGIVARFGRHAHLFLFALVFKSWMRRLVPLLWPGLKSKVWAICFKSRLFFPQGISKCFSIYICPGGLENKPVKSSFNFKAHRLTPYGFRGTCFLAVTLHYASPPPGSSTGCCLSLYP